MMSSRRKLKDELKNRKHNDLSYEIEYFEKYNLKAQDTATKEGYG